MTKQDWNELLQEMLNETIEKVERDDGNRDHWEKLYNAVFSDNISHKIQEQFPSFEWFDPDADYEDDVRAFIKEFNWFANPDEE